MSFLDNINTYPEEFSFSTPKPAVLSALQGNYMFNPKPIADDPWERVRQGWSSDWDESQALWKQSQEEGFFPGIFHKLGAVLTPLDMPRRAAWRGASGITDPLLEMAGIEHPEDLTSGFEVGNKLAEKYTPQVTPIADDAPFLNKLGKEIEYRVKGLPAIAAQTAGNVFDIYSDPLSMVSIKKPTLRRLVEEEVTKPFTTPASSFASLTEERNPTFFKQFNEITPENIPDVSARYLQTRIEDRVQELLNAREEIQNIPDIARKRVATEFVDNQLSKLQAAGESFASPDYATHLENYRNQNLPPIKDDDLKDVLNPFGDAVLNTLAGSHSANRAYPKVEGLNLAAPGVPPELQKALPYSYDFLTPEILADRQVRLEKTLRSQKEGLKATLPFAGQEQFNIPLVTDLTGMIGKGIGKLASGAKELVHKAFFDAASSKDLSILDQPAPPEVVQAINNILPQTVGKEIKARDVEGILTYISQTPGGITNYAQARDLASRLAGTNRGNDVLTELKPIFEYLPSLGELSPVKQGNLAQITEAFKKAQEDIANAKSADLFQKSYKDLQAENIDFDQLQQVNKRRIYQWMLRQFKQNPNNPALLNELNSYVGPNNVQRVAKAKQRYDAMSTTDWATSNNLDKALVPDIDRLATMQTLDDLITQRTGAIKSQTIPTNTLDAAKQIIQSNLESGPVVEVIPKIIEQMGLQSKYAPVPFMLAKDDNAMSRGILNHIDDLDFTYQEHLADITNWYAKADSNQLINFLYSSPSKVQSAISDAAQLWHTQRQGNPSLGASISDPAVVAKMLSDKLERDINDPAIQQFANLFSQATKQAQGEWVNLLSTLDSNLSLMKDQHRSFLNTLIPMRAMAAEKSALARPIYEQLVFGSIPHFKAAREMMFNPAKASIPAKAAIWQAFSKLKTDLTRGIWRDYGMEPEAAEMTRAGVRNIDYWNQRVADMAEQELIKNLYEPMLRDAGIPLDKKKLDQIDQGVVYRYGYRTNLERQQQGTQLLIDAFNGDSARAEAAYAKWVEFHERQMDLYQIKDNQAGIPTQYRQNYLPHMLKSGSAADFKRVQEARKVALTQQSGSMTTQTPGIVGADYGHAHQRDFQSLDEYENFLTQLNNEQSANFYNQITKSNLQPETSYIRLYAQRLRNHHVAVNSLQYLREMELQFPHLIRSIRDVDKDLDSLLSTSTDPASQTLGQAGGADYKLTPSTPVSSLVGAPQKWSLRPDFAKYLQSYISYSSSNIDPVNIVERALKGMDLFNYKLQNLNTAFNGPGHIARILANALVGNVNFRLALDNIAKYGPNPRLHPLYDDAARAGVFPWAGIDHNKNIREVMDIRMGRPDTGTLENPVKYGSTSPPIDVRVGKWNVFRTPGMGLDRIAGFTAKMREPELSRYITWEVADKNIRLAMYEQALEIGMNKVQAADYVRDALIDYQMSWHDARLKMYANAIFPFYSWWIGNLRLHLPNMLQEPRMYVIANHVANMANWYAVGNYREDNPDGFSSAIALPIQNGPEMIYFQLGLPWETVQNKIVKQLYDTWMAPTSVEDPLDLGARLNNTKDALAAYVNKRASSIPVQLIMYLMGLKKQEPGYVAPQFRNAEDLINYLKSLAGDTFWGITPVAAPVAQYIAGDYPGRNLPVTLTRSALGMLGPTPRISQTGERLDY